MRYLLLIAMVLVVALLWRRLIHKIAPPSDKPADDRSEEAMVQCRVCGVYLPVKESFREGAFHYCSEAHRNQDRSG